MDIFDVLLQAGLITSALVAYLIFFRKPPVQKGHYKDPGWNYPLKRLLALYAVKRWKCQLSPLESEEMPRTNLHEGWDGLNVRASAPNGAAVLVSVRKLCGRKPLAEISVHVKLQDGTAYRLSQHPDTVVGAWESIPDGWCAGGLKIQIIEPELRLRITFNGLLTRLEDNVTQHVKMNLIWSSVTKVVRYPEDWNDELAAQALALEPWRDDKWTGILGKWEDGGWLQWGAAQGRFVSYDVDGKINKSEYLQIRGVKERSWSPHGYEGIRRSFTVTMAAKDGTAIMLRGVSYKNVLTECMSGCVRFPDYTVQTIRSTDVIMSDFCETPEGIPKVYTINVSTRNRDLRVVMRINPDGGRLYSGVPYHHEIVYRTIMADINGESGTGVIELGYAPKAISHPQTRLAPARLLKWLSERDVGVVSYCVSFEERTAACASLVGGKGVSLALLTSVQKDEGYRVPPGFCLTTRALEKHLEMNPTLRAAIRDIEAANEDYHEANFKEKCKTASDLFNVTDIAGDVKDEILSHLNKLRTKGAEEKLGPNLRFAVRSSAVGEDSEALSAAGQNETILGCESDLDVLRGVQKCWGSMFAFTSAYYRRQNGQPCFCGGGVVVQILVAPRVAGVMFTRHPDAGDPSRLLITANYGLGESVVSGAVEPDTIIIKRDTNGRLSILKSELGSKCQRVIATDDGVTVVDVSEADRGEACLSDAEVLRLAQLGVSQEELWGGGRDIEWAISKDEIFLLQARPITSLERWTEEELLHELDFPIMADDELTTFGNAGEVMPKPLTPMTYDFVIMPLTRGMDRTIGTNGSGFDQSIILTHNRCAMDLYNSVYRTVSNEIDVNIRMIEMAIHGHKVADANIMRTAITRRPPYWFDKLRVFSFLIKSLATTKWKMDDSIAKANGLVIQAGGNDPLKLMDDIAPTEQLMEHLIYNHGITSSASTGSQFIAMTILLEGNSDFTPEHCSEIGTLLSSGDVLSAEVPHALARLARQLQHSGLGQEFQALDPKQAFAWLKDNLPHVYLDVCTFLEQHGHRAIMEFDLSTKPWTLVPEDMMKVLQNMRSIPEESHKTKTTAEIVASLKSPQKTSTKKILPWVLPLCHRTVRHREGTKAHLILAIHKLRLAFFRLADSLVRQWYLPNRDVIFFFRFKELRQYIITRDPALLKKALQRQQLYPSWSKLKFAEVNTGWVVPLDIKAPTVTVGDVRVEGTSVCGKEVVARACVVKDLSEIDQLQQGDVLITHATDIGWSPYFPLLTGIVTELGGLISHGAVIAREYGLPCIVGAANATDIFKTGDLVRLSGNKGVIEKVQMADKTADGNGS